MKARQKPHFIHNSLHRAHQECVVALVASPELSLPRSRIHLEIYVGIL